MLVNDGNKAMIYMCCRECCAKIETLLVGWVSIVFPCRAHTGYLDPVNVVRWRNTVTSGGKAGKGRWCLYSDGWMDG